MKPVIVGISGASGSLLAKGTVDELILREIPTALVCSNDARLVWQEEIDQPFTDVLYIPSSHYLSLTSGCS